MNMVRDCTHPRARHEHGTRNAYVCDRCRCVPCRSAATTAERDRRRAQLYGRYDGLVDADPVRAHVLKLSAAGVGLKRITALTGVSGGVLSKLMYGLPLPDGSRRPPCRRVKPRTAQLILAIQPGQSALAGGALVDATGTRRRLEALVSLGWSQSRLAERLGMARANFGKVIASGRVVVSTRDAVRRLFDELWDTAPPEDDYRSRIAASRARRYAKERGYAPPLAWDDESIDDPAARPLGSTAGRAVRALDEVAVERAMRGDPPAHLTKAERLEAVRRLTALGLSARVIAERINVSSRTVTRRRAA